MVCRKINRKKKIRKQKNLYLQKWSSQTKQERNDTYSRASTIAQSQTSKMQSDTAKTPPERTRKNSIQSLFIKFLLKLERTSSFSRSVPVLSVLPVSLVPRSIVSPALLHRVAFDLLGGRFFKFGVGSCHLHGKAARYKKQEHKECRKSFS